MLSTSPEWLSLLSRRKLQSAGASGVGTRDNRSLRRFVLLKNSIVRADVSITETEAEQPEQEGEDEEIEEVVVVDTPHATEHCTDEDEELFVFPDASSLDKAAGDSAEAAWFNALLEDLEDDSIVPTPPPLSYDDPDLVDEDEDDYLPSLFFSETQEPSLEVPSCPPLLSVPVAPYLIPESALPLPQSEDGDAPPSLEDHEEYSDADSDCPPTPSFGRSTTSLSSLPLSSWDERELRAGHSPPDDAARVFVQELTYFDYHDSAYPYAAC